MNILPKKRWHVRTRENIARVRRDEANAAKEEEEKQNRIKLAEQEARTNVLRARARLRYDGRDGEKDDIKREEIKKEIDMITSDGHVNFFTELEQGLVSSTATNKEHDEELKQEREKYEKQIGYLTYLGQDTVEATGNVSWYNKTPMRERESEKDEEIGLKHKLNNDPLKSVQQFCFSRVKTSSPSCSTSLKRKHRSSSSSSPSDNNSHKVKRSKKDKKKKKKSKHKKSEKHYSSSSNSSESSEESDSEKKKKLEKLRAERRRREEEEKKRSEKLLAKINGLPYEDKDKPDPKPVMQQKYNSQFNPSIARQNYRD